MVLRTFKRLIPDRHPLRLRWHKHKALMAARQYGFPAKELTVIGVTGTDGKTTTVGMIAHILNANGVKTGALSTAFFQIGNTIEWNATQKTSPSPFVIQQFLRRLVNEGCTHAVLEYSSHGLVQGRTDHTWPLVAGITNISEEHLDYHGTMDNYIRDKGLLFRMLRPDGVKVLNAADRTFEPYSAIPSRRTIAYATERAFSQPATDSECAVWTTDMEISPAGSTAVVHCNADPILHDKLALKIPGSFNIDNALCAIGCAHAAGVGMKGCIQSLSSFTGVPGRMEPIDEGQAFHVLVDFTVTPKSYEKTLGTLRSMLQPGKRLLVLTGSCGDRMKEKRPIVGKIVSTHADVMVVANEDPYTEDPEKIIDDVWAGIDQSATEAHRIFDRREAIRFLLKAAKPGDIVVLCGKGSDTTMMMKDGQVPWNERAITRELLRTMKK